MKIAPLYHALKKETWAEPVIVHTGQHYDLNMSDVFFQNLELLFFFHQRLQLLHFQAFLYLQYM